MRVRLLSRLHHGGGVLEVGDCVDVEDGRGRRMCELGIAEPVQRSRPQPTQTVSTSGKDASEAPESQDSTRNDDTDPQTKRGKRKAKRSKQ